MRIRIWPIEARLHSWAPTFSFVSIALVFAIMGSLYLMGNAKNERAIMCLAENIYHEARGGKAPEKYIIGMLTLARVADPDPQWSKTVCVAVAKERQYSWVLERRLATNRNEQAKWEE